MPGSVINVCLFFKKLVGLLIFEYISTVDNSGGKKRSEEPLFLPSSHHTQFTVIMVVLIMIMVVHDYHHILKEKVKRSLPSSHSDSVLIYQQIAAIMMPFTKS